MRRIVFLITVVIIFALTGCVDKQTYQDLKEDYDTLKAEYEENEAQLETLLEDKENLLAQIATLTSDKETLQTEKDALETSLTNKQNEYDEYVATTTQQITEKTERISELESTIETKEAELTAKLTEIRILTEDKTDLETTLALKVTELETANATVSSLTQAKEQLETDLAAKAAELETANETVTTLTTAKQQLEVNLAIVEAALIEANNENTNLLNQKAQLQTDLENTQALLQTATETITSLNNKIIQLEQDLADTSAELEIANNTINNLNRNISQLETDLRQVETLLYTANITITDLRDEINGLNTTIDNQLDEIDQLNGQIASITLDYNNQIAALESTINDKELLLANMDIEITNLNAEILDLEQQKLALMEDNADLLIQLDAKDTQIEQLDQDIATLSADIIDLQAELELKVAEITSLISQIEDYDYRLTLALRELELYKQDLVYQGSMLVGNKNINYKVYGSIDQFELHTVGTELGLRFRLTEEMNLNIINPDEELMYKLQCIDDIVIKYFDENNNLLASKHSFWSDFLVPVEVNPDNLQDWTHIDVDGDGTVTNTIDGDMVDRFGFGDVIPTTYTYSTTLKSYGDSNLLLDNIDRVEIFAVNRPIDTSIIYVDDDFASLNYGDVHKINYNGNDLYVVYGTNSFSSLQDALKEANDNSTIYVYQGEYAVTSDTEWFVDDQAGWYLPITQDNLTIQGLDQLGQPITSRPDATTILPTVYGTDYTANGALASQNLVTIFGNDVTIQGLHIMPKVDPNKVIETLGANPTLKYNKFTGNTLNPLSTALYDGEWDMSNYGGNIYISEFDIVGTSNVTIKDNYFNHVGISFHKANKDGNKVIENNIFDSPAYAKSNVTGEIYYYGLMGASSWGEPLVTDLVTIYLRNNEFTHFENTGVSIIRNHMNGSFILENNLITGSKETDKDILVMGNYYDLTVTGQIIVNSYQDNDGNEVFDAYTLTYANDTIIVDANLVNESDGAYVRYDDVYYNVGRNAFASLQDALKVAQSGDTLYVYQGEYAITSDTEWLVDGQTGWYLPITQDNLTIQGMDESGQPITSRPDSTTSLPTVYGADYTANGALASQNLITIFGDNVTIKGLHIMPKVDPNKVIETLGANPTLQYNKFTGNTINPITTALYGEEWDMSHYGGNIYISESDIVGTSNVTIKDNYFNHVGIGFHKANKEGNKIVEGNIFDSPAYAQSNITGEIYYYNLMGTPSWGDPLVTEFSSITLRNNKFLNFENTGISIIITHMNGTFILENNLITGSKETDKEFLKIGNHYDLTTTGQIIVNSYQDNDGNEVFDAYTLTYTNNTIIVDANLVNETDGAYVRYNDVYYNVGKNAFASLNDAVASTNDGDIIYVYPGTYDLNSTLTITNEISIIGDSQDSVIINYTSADGYGMLVQGSNVTLSNFTLNTPIIEWYPIKVEKYQVDGVWNYLLNININNIAVHNNSDLGRTGIDLNGVNGGSISNVEVYNSGNGNGIALTDCSDITLSDITTSGNAWGGIAIYTSSNGSNNIIIEDSVTSNELNPIYVGEHSGYEVTNLTLPSTYDYVIEGSQTYYQTSATDAMNFSDLLMLAGKEVTTIKSIDSNNYYVIEGLSIYDAVNASSEGSIIYIKEGTYQLPTTLNINKGISLIGDGEDVVTLDASNRNGWGIYLSNTNTLPIKLAGFTLIGTNNNNYGIHTGGTIDFYLHHLTVKDFNASGIDLNTSSFGLLENITSINNNGNGIQLANAFDIELNNIHTSGNAWAGIGMFTNNAYYYGHEGINHVVLQNIDGVEDGIYLEDGNHSDYLVPISYSFDLSDNANVTILSEQHKVVYFGTRADGLIHTMFFNSVDEALLQAENTDYTTEFIYDVINDTYIVRDNMSIQKAIDLANNGATIQLVEGQFIDQGTIQVNKNLTILGIGTMTVVKGTKFVVGEEVSMNFGNMKVDGTGLTTNTGFISNNGSYSIGDIVIDNVTFMNMSTWPVYVYNGDTFTATNNTITMKDCTHKTAMMIWTNTNPWTDVLITNNNILFTGITEGARGIQIQGAMNVVARDNIFDMGYYSNVTTDDYLDVWAKTRYAMQISENQGNVLITNNLIKNAYDGIVTLGVGDKDNFVITDNTFENLRNGIRPYAGLDDELGHTFNYLEVSNNTFSVVLNGLYLSELGTNNTYNTVKYVNNTYVFTTNELKVINPDIIAVLETDIPLVVESMTLTEPNDKDYLVGTPNLDLTGGFITVTYSYGYSIEAPLTQDMISGYNPDILGTQVITITYNGQQFYYIIVVYDYIANETFDYNVDGWIHDGYGVNTWVDGGYMLVEANTDETHAGYSFYNSARMTYWPGTWYAEIDVYLDPNDFNLGDGFDYSQAVSSVDGGHIRDYIIHITKDTSTGNILVGATNNTGNLPNEELENDNHAVITDAGWYTIQYRFFDDNGYLGCELNLIDENGVIVFTKLYNDQRDAMSTVGGNSYSWFCAFVKENGLLVDNHQMYQ